MRFVEGDFFRSAVSFLFMTLQLALQRIERRVGSGFEGFGGFAVEYGASGQAQADIDDFFLNARARVLTRLKADNPHLTPAEPVADDPLQFQLPIPM